MTDAAAYRFIADHFGAVATDVRWLGAGDWSRAYAIVLDGRQAVIRFGDHVEDFRKDQAMARHSSATLPVPVVSKIGIAGDGYFAVSERASGELLNNLDEAGMRAALPGLLTAMDTLHHIDAPGTGYGIWAPDGTGPAESWAQALLSVNEETARVPGWRAAMAASPVGMRTFDLAYARLRELAEDVPDERHIIHRDLLNRNVLVQGSRNSGAAADGRGWRPVWEGARAGDRNEIYRLYVRSAPAPSIAFARVGESGKAGSAHGVSGLGGRVKKSHRPLASRRS